MYYDTIYYTEYSGNVGKQDIYCMRFEDLNESQHSMHLKNIYYRMSQILNSKPTV